MNHVTHSLSSADISTFSPRVDTFCYIKKYWYIFDFDTEFLIHSNFSESLRIALVNRVTTLMMSSKMATLASLTIKLFEIRVMAA